MAGQEEMKAGQEKMGAYQENMEAVIKCGQEEMKATVRASQRKMGDQYKLHSVRNGRDHEKSGGHPVVCQHGTQGLREVLNAKIQETQLGLQAVSTTLDTRTKSLHDEIGNTKKGLQEERDLRIQGSQVETGTTRREFKTQ
jgi:hypothetical protein